MTATPETMVTLREVRAAFDALLALVRRTCEVEDCLAVQWATDEAFDGLVCVATQREVMPSD